MGNNQSGLFVKKKKKPIIIPRIQKKGKVTDSDLSFLMTFWFTRVDHFNSTLSKLFRHKIPQQAEKMYRVYQKHRKNARDARDASF